ncbi:MAG: hypothetical protein LBK82_13180 [Planctomycetaceae bacterium]|jgi:hypothetical protein|nr:hypothetical protein [Planctomycetaceae bacterium]
MKLGLILECPTEGTDHLVYKYVAQQLCPQLKIIVEGHRNKKLMIDNCGKTAKLLLKNCDAVAIIWDLMPPWEEKRRRKPCRNRDVDMILKNLENANIDRLAIKSKIKLICIEPELEAWIITERKALESYQQEKHPTHPKRFCPPKNISRTSKYCKPIIEKYLGNYNDIYDAIKIVQHFDNFDKVARKHTSFRRLKEFIDDLCQSSNRNR